MTCKDCIHYELCLPNSGAYGFKLKLCSKFKPKSRYIELPCAVGDKVYWINPVKKQIETDIVVSIHQYENGFSITSDTLGNKCTSTYSLDRFLEIMHFTKEEAEAALEERK